MCTWTGERMAPVNKYVYLIYLEKSLKKMILQNTTDKSK